MRLYTIFLLLVVLICSAPVYADSSNGENGSGFGGFVENTSGINVNWGNGFISAASEVQPMLDTIDPVRTRALAVRQGGVSARKKLLDAVFDLSLDGSRKVSAVLSKKPKVMNSLRGFVQNSLLDTAMLESGQVEVTASLDIRNGISAIIIPPTISFLTGIPPTISGRRNDASALQDLGEDVSSENREAAVYSGVIFDARGFKIDPVILPVIYDGRGVGVYGAFAVSRESVLKNGMVAYMVDEKSENMRSRVGNFPLLVKPVNTQKGNHSNLILSLDDAARVRVVLKRKAVIRNCAVAILVDGPATIAESMAEEGTGSVVSPEMPTSDAVNGIQEDSLDENGSPRNEQ